MTALLLAFGRDRHGVADGGTVQGDGAVAAGHGGAQLGDWLVGPGFDDLHPGLRRRASGHGGDVEAQLAAQRRLTRCPPLPASYLQVAARVARKG